MRVDTNSSLIENSFIMKRGNNKNVNDASDKQYNNVSEYYDYLKNKYKCLSDSAYKVNISPVYLEKCINDPECAELLEKNLAHLPASHQNMTAFWSARGAEVVNEQWNFDENGNVGGSPGMYVVSKNSHETGSNVQEKALKKKTGKKSALLQENYEKRKQLKEEFDARQAKKEIYRELIKDHILSRRQNMSRAIEKYNKNI